MEELWALTAAEISKLFKAKEVSAVEICNDTIEHIEKINPKINAIVVDTFVEARKTASTLDKKLKNKEDLGSLAAVPVTIKVNTDQIGYASTNGLRIQKELIATKDSPVVKNLKSSDALIVGRTNTPAFSIHWFTRNSLHGHSLNPHNDKITPGRHSWFYSLPSICMWNTRFKTKSWPCSNDKLYHTRQTYWWTNYGCLRPTCTLNRRPRNWIKSNEQRKF